VQSFSQRDRQTEEKTNRQTDRQVDIVVVKGKLQLNYSHIYSKKGRECRLQGPILPQYLYLQHPPPPSNTHSITSSSNIYEGFFKRNSRLELRHKLF
jgi:hypothetical protein